MENKTIMNNDEDSNIQQFISTGKEVIGKESADSDTNIQPLSIEEALAAAEVAASAYDVSDNPEESTDAVDDTISAATYNPDLVIADLEKEAPSIVEEATGNLNSADSLNEMLEVAAEEAEEKKVLATEEAKKDEVSLPDAKAAIKEFNEEIGKSEAASSQPSKPAPKKKAPAKKPAKAPDAKVSASVATEDKPAKPEASAVDNTLTAEVKEDALSAKINNKSKTKKTKEEPVEEKIAEPVVVDIEEEKEKKKRKKRNLEPEKNFKLLKTLIIVLSLLATGISGHIYYSYMLDIATGFSWYKLIPIIPLCIQVLLLLISLITVGTSKRKPIGATIKANAAEKKAVAAEKEEIRINKEIEDTLLVPEIDLTPKKSVELSNFQIENFYKKSIEEINGKYYMQIAKFDDSVKVFETRGATDMELVAVNMVGSAKFDEILVQPRAKTLSSKELVSYFLSKPGTFAIKKRGALDWTFKYSSKSFGIIRENGDNYKVSIKCYPDAATKLNDVYKALEDSNFPSGPLWFCFNELRNLPPRVCKWLIDTSCQISKFQQIKTDVLKDDKTLLDYDINLAEIAAKFKAGETIINYPKFTIIFSKGDDADLTTYLTREKEGVDASGFTKEFYYKFTTSNDAISVLCPTKGVSEEIIICLFDNIEKIL